MKYIFLLFIPLLLFGSETLFVTNIYKKYYKKRSMTYARNIWDMQLYKNKIYIGGGNSSNKPPAANAGRVPIYSLDPKTDKIKFEYKVAEEQVNIFRIFDNILYIPGHDATQKWDFGNFYTKKNGKWKKYRTIPKALHVYDLIKLNKKLYVSTGLLHYKGSIMVSNDNGNSWKTLKKYQHRVYSLSQLNNTIICSNNLTQKKLKAIRLKYTNHTLFYIEAKPYNDHQYVPLKFKRAKLYNNQIISTAIGIPKFYLPYDILIRNKSIYLLINKKLKSGYNIKVIKYNINKLYQYKEILSFQYPSFARSFEKTKDGTFYFGIGCTPNNINKWCGDIIKVVR